jgi:hypothetical protein
MHLSVDVFSSPKLCIPQDPPIPYHPHDFVTLIMLDDELK